MWPIFLLKSALLFAASTIKNPASKNALLLEDSMKEVFDAIRMTYAGNPKFKC